MTEFHPVFHPVEHVSPGSNQMAMTGLILLCDHARNAVPTEIGDLGLPPGDMGRHIAWDVGARGVTLGLAARLGAGAGLSTFSRPVIDPHRRADDPPRGMGGTAAQHSRAQRRSDEAAVERRKSAWHRPSPAAPRAAIDGIVEAGETPVLVSIHSFTPQFKGRAPRPWHVGRLWDRDDRLVRPLLARLRAADGLVVGDNEPYSGQLHGDCMWTHGSSRGLPHVLIEIRNDLIESLDDQAGWAARLAPMIREAVAEMNGA